MKRLLKAKPSESGAGVRIIDLLAGPEPLRLPLFGKRFSLLLDLACDKTLLLRDTTDKIINSTCLGYLQNIGFVSRVVSQQDVLTPFGYAYLAKIADTEIEKLPLPNLEGVGSWAPEMDWVQILRAVDDPMDQVSGHFADCSNKVLRAKWTRIKLCNSAGYTSERGCQLLRRLCRDYPLQVVAHVISEIAATSPRMSDELLRNNKNCLRYLARHIPAKEWAVLLLKIKEALDSGPDDGWQRALRTGRRREILVQLTGILKLLI